MNEALRATLEAVRSGALSVDEAALRLAIDRMILHFL